MRIACVGGGPAGLYFALLMKLRDSAHDITVFERNTAGSTQGWGVTFGRNMRTELHRCDPVSADEIDKAACRQFDQVVDIHGTRVMHPGGGGYGIGRQRLLDILAARAAGLGVRVEYGHEVLNSPRLPPADLVVACDGVNSRTRLAAGRFETSVRVGGNKYLWLGTSKVFEAFTYAFVRTECGWIWCYGYGAGPGLSTFIVECSAETWDRLGFGVLPPQDSITLLEKFFARQLEGHSLLADAQRDGSTGWLNFRTVTNQRWHDGNTVLVGDAAHTTHFTIGSGTTLAIEDAIALAGSLRQHGGEHDGERELALGSYERQRKAALLRAQSDARFSARWFEDVSRYADLDAREFSALLHGRRSPLLPYLPPRLYYRLHQATEDVAVLGELRRRVGPRVKAIYSLRRRVRPERPDCDPRLAQEPATTSRDQFRRDSASFSHPPT
jgi:2-polyprenyl-6-methoxyphenol hydroxylase-like FAD-dependent oxidoreductase